MKRIIITATLAALACAAPRQATPSTTTPQRPLRFPDHFPSTERIPGLELQALIAVAKDLERIRVQPDSGEDEVTRCLHTLQARGFTVREEEGVFYIMVSFEPELCGSTATYVDSGVIYAVDKDGNIIGKK